MVNPTYDIRDFINKLIIHAKSYFSNNTSLLDHCQFSMDNIQIEPRDSSHTGLVSCCMEWLVWLGYMVLSMPVKGAWHGYLEALLKPPGGIPQALNLSGGARFIARHPRYPFLGECQWGPETFLELWPSTWTHLKKSLVPHLSSWLDVQQIQQHINWVPKYTQVKYFEIQCLLINPFFRNIFDLFL